MVRARAHEGRRHSPGLVGLAAILLILYSATPASPQSEPALELTPLPIMVERAFIVRFTVPFLESSELRVEAPENLPDTVRLAAGPSLLPFAHETRTGAAPGKSVEVQFEFRAIKAGRRIFPPIVFQVRGRRQQTQAALLEVSRQGKTVNVPFDAAWRLADGELFEGQAFLALLEVSNVPELVVADSVSLLPPAGLLMEEVKGLGSIGTEGVPPFSLFRVPVAAYLVTAPKRGRISLPRAAISIRGMQQQAAELPVDIQPLPQAAASSGAVGAFFYSSWVESADVQFGKPIMLHLRVEGEGNLHFLRVPDPAPEGLLVVEKKALQRFVPSERGYRGHLELIYRLQAQTPGAFTLKTAAFAWLDRASTSVSVAPGKSFTVTVTEKPATPAVKAAEERPRFLGAGEVLLHEGSALYRDPRSYLLLLPGAAGLALAAGLKRRRGGSAAILAVLGLAGMLIAADSGPGEADLRLLNQADRAYRAGDYRQSLLALLEVQKNYPVSAGLRYNLGVAHFRNGDKALAVHHLRQAIRQNPLDRVFLDGLEKIEQVYGLTGQIPLPAMPPDVWWAGFIILANLAMLVAAGLLIKVRAGLVILLVLSLMAGLGAGAGLVLEAGRSSRPEGVIGPSPGDLKRVPRPDAKTWRLLEVGGSVEILSSSGDFVFVRSALGVEGWLAASDLVRD